MGLIWVCFWSDLRPSQAGAAVDVVSQLAGTGSMAGHVLMVLTLGVLLSTLTAWPLTVWLLLMPAAMLYMRCVETKYVQGVQSLVQSQMWRAILMATTDRDNAEVCLTAEQGCFMSHNNYT
jgi:uncharacterized protein YqjF (DUF2071 family)